jgi:phosphatidylinositol dimannoside acyltransferase
MNLQNLINGRFGVWFGLLAGRHLPHQIAYPLIKMIASLIARQKNSPMIQSIRANQWVVSGESLSGPELDQQARQVLQNTGRNIYDFYHNLHDSQKIIDLVELNPSFEALLECNRGKRLPLIWVAPHQSNFDLMIRSLLLRGAHFQALSYPQPKAGYRMQNKVREHPGLMLTPMSLQALRQASETLRANGAVVTGVDRPLPDPEAKYQPNFFGRPASLPMLHIRLALKHDLPITVAAGYRKPDGKTIIMATEPIPMQRYPDLHEETIRNAETILSAVETYIRVAPEQWAMFYPVWPETLKMVPR